VADIASDLSGGRHQPSAILGYFFLALAFVVLAFVLGLGFAFDVFAAHFAIISPPFLTHLAWSLPPVQSITSLPLDRSMSIGSKA